MKGCLISTNNPDTKPVNSFKKKKGSGTWMEDFPHRQCRVAVGFEILWQRGVIACTDSPVGVEIIQSGGVWPSTCKERCSAWGTYCLLRRKEKQNKLYMEISSHAQVNLRS